MKHKLSDVETKDFLLLLNFLFGEHKLPYSKYVFENDFLSCVDGMVFHLYCSACEYYLGHYSDKERNKRFEGECPQCNKPFKTGCYYERWLFFYHNTNEKSVETLA